ncbi:MAG: response regulator transcription factor [Bacteriovorax sp.]|nr:response regulator transcription factor [Bacteriovorax sp.]
MTNLKFKKILIVEDDVDILFSLEMLLENEGYTVQVAENGAVALELIKNNGLPNLILLDMMMPVMNGWQFGLKVHALYGHLCPIVVMTAAADAQQRAKDINAIDWLEKPFNFKKLLTLIKKHVNADENIAENLNQAIIQLK